MNYNGKVYELVPAVDQGTCTGCAFDLPGSPCLTISDTQECDECWDIWKEVNDTTENA